MKKEPKKFLEAFGKEVGEAVNGMGHASRITKTISRRENPVSDIVAAYTDSPGVRLDDYIAEHLSRQKIPAAIDGGKSTVQKVEREMAEKTGSFSAKGTFLLMP